MREDNEIEVDALLTELIELTDEECEPEGGGRARSDDGADPAADTPGMEPR